MTDMENIIDEKRISEQQNTNQEEPQNKSIPITDNLIDEKITNIHTYLFDILTFFSNFQPNLIVEYCQERQHVCNEYPHFE